MSKATKSPIKDLPVRLPGQSVREHFNNFTDEEALFIASLVIIPSIFAAYEWFVYFTKSRPSPWFITALAMLAVLYAILRLRKFLKKAKQLKLGAIGEEAVGQYLEEKLRPMGCQVLHDIQFDGFNIDHVVMSRTFLLRL